MTFPIVNATCFLGVLEQGSTRPLYFEAEDGNRYVVKPGGRNLPDHFSELLAVAIAPAFAVNTPKAAVVRFAPFLVRALRDIGESTAADNLEAADGTAFGSRWVNGATILEDLYQTSPRHRQLGLVATLDAYLGNADRSFQNPNLLRLGRQILAIDHAQGFPWLYGHPHDDLSAINGHISANYGIPPGPVPALSERLVKAFLSDLPRSWFEQVRLDYADAVDRMMARVDVVSGLLAQRNIA
jgi:hypothetical protein